MSVAARIIGALSLVPEDTDLIAARTRAFSHQIPLLYFMLVTNTGMLAYTHFYVAPPLLTLTLPIVLVLVAIQRLLAWRRMRYGAVEAGGARMLTGTVRNALLLGIAFTTWAISLYPYGGPYEQVYIAFYVGITVVGCLYCLSSVPAAAFVLIGVVIVPVTAFLLTTGNPIMTALAINLLLVTGALAVLVLNHARDFSDLVESRKQLMARQAETERLSDENRRLAGTDALTGLPNRRRFFAELDAHLARTGDGSGFAVGLIDLDGFKPVNDLHGHLAGDRVLIEAGRRLEAVCGPGVFLARLGGDEFGLLIAGRDDDALAMLGARISDALRVPFETPGMLARISASVGLARHPGGGADAEQLFEHADFALYFAKQNRRGAAVVFSRAHENKIRDLKLIEHALRHADLERELFVVFQPIVNARTGRPTAFEALARWDSPVLGLVSPAGFINAAERSGQMGRLTVILLEKALAEAASWPPDTRVSFNLSARDIANAETMRRVVDIVQKSRLDPARIDIEITETAVVNDYEKARTVLHSLRALGLGVALDDFGTGYSSLSYIRALPLDKIKIDRAFIEDIETDPTCRAIVRTVVGLSRDLGLACVVEGVETASQHAILRELGVGLLQGYHFSRPIPADAVPALLARWAQDGPGSDGDGGWPGTAGRDIAGPVAGVPQARAYSGQGADP